MTNCWEYTDCPEEQRNRCPAHPDRGLDCWKVTGTLCDQGRHRAKSLEEKIARCRKCDFYIKHAHRF